MLAAMMSASAMASGRRLLSQVNGWNFEEIRDGRILVANMQASKGNAVSDTFNVHFKEMLAVVREENKPVIFTGTGKIFCSGLDLLGMFEEGCSKAEHQSRFHRVMTNFGDNMLNFLTLPVPVATAVNGHAYAAGAILAMAGDIRVGSADDTSSQIGAIEVQMGVPLPVAALAIFKRTLAPHLYTEALLFSKCYTMEEAHNSKILHSLAPSRDRLIEHTADLLSAIPASSLPAFAGSKACLLEQDVAHCQATSEASIDASVNCFFSDASYAATLKRVAKLRSKN